ncbi:cell division protein FtsN [Psychromonas sp. CNPT3]|uniref:SPOR domain-containing protein n=1 Tax=Psychromonas sp. CNPT3 TaxID=314282 RepID=UPI00006E50B3|nr:SPOR domain-containing protein [Psychromonas sp. CNPT3]AGH80001.1 cell division protein FtsN [Psychromonas sp. CNPT3]
MAKRPVKRTTRKRPVSKRKQAKKGFPFLAVTIATLLIGFIGYFVFAVDKPEPIKVVQPTIVKKVDLLPEKPEPRWEYEQALKVKKVEVDIPEKQLSTRPYLMQCGSFRNLKDAETLKVRIAFQGLNTVIKKTNNWYRVVLGPYERKRLAEKDRHKLQRARIDGCMIWYWNL